MKAFCTINFSPETTRAQAEEMAEALGKHWETSGGTGFAVFFEEEADETSEGALSDSIRPNRLPRFARLTTSERRMLKLLAEGKTIKEIACSLDRSFKTIEAHKFNLMRKLDIHNKAQLAVYAVQQGIIKLRVPPEASRGIIIDKPIRENVRTYSTESLSTREKEISACVAKGLKNAEIARALGISEQTVKNHLHNIFDKIRVPDRLALALHYIKHLDATAGIRSANSAAQ